MARIPTRNEAVPWGDPPDPNNPPPAYPGISAKKFNPVEAQRCYAEALYKEREFRSMHQLPVAQGKLPAFLGERPGRRSMDMMPGYSSVWASYDKLGWEHGLAGRVLQPSEAPGHAEQPRSRPKSAGAAGFRLQSAGAPGAPPTPPLASACTPELRELAEQTQWPTFNINDERAANAAGGHGHRAWSLLRPATAPARPRDRYVAQASELRGDARRGLESSASQRRSASTPGRACKQLDRAARGSSSGRTKAVAAHKESIRCRQLFKQLLNERLTLG